MDENIFDVIDPVDLPTNDDDKNYLEELVGENKKFKTVNDLAKGKAHADAAIDVLKKKLDELNAELKTRTSLDSFLTELRKPADRVPEAPVITPDTPQPNIDAQTLEAKIEELLARKEASRQAESNQSKVTRVLSEHFGDQAKLAVNKRANEVGMSVSELQALALKSPAAFFTLMGVSETAPTRPNAVIPQSQVNTLNQKTSTGVRGRSYYEKMKAQNPKQYFSQEVTVQMMKDKAALGHAQFEAS